MIILKSRTELEVMREAGRIVAETHQELAKAVKPGVTTKELDELAETVYSQPRARFRRLKATMAFLEASVLQLTKNSYMGSRENGRCKKEISSVSTSEPSFRATMAIPLGPMGSAVFPKKISDCCEVTEESLYEGLGESQARTHDCPTSLTRFRSMQKMPVSRSFGSMWGMGSGKICMKIRKFRTTVLLIADHGLNRVWCLRSNRW